MRISYPVESGLISQISKYAFMIHTMREVAPPVKSTVMNYEL